MKKKAISIILASLMTVSLLAVSGGAVMADEPEYPEMHLQIGHACREDSNSHIACQAFADKLEELSGGKITSEIFPLGSLGSDIQMLENVMIGDLDVTSGSPFAVNQATGLDAVLLYDLPWFVGDGDNLNEIRKNDPAFKKIYGEMLEEKGVKVLGFSHAGSYIFNSTIPVTNAEELVGVKMRTAENPLIVDMLTSLKAKPVVINMFELFTALEQGTCDGAYVPDSIDYQVGIYEAAPYMTVLENAYCTIQLSVSMDFWNSLDPATQAIFEEAGEAYSQAAFDYLPTQNEQIYGDFEKAGVEVVYLSDEEKAAFREACQDVHDAWREKIGPELYDMSAEFIAGLNK